MIELELVPEQWFVDRQLSFKPKHFIGTRSQLTKESLNWVVYNLKGRFCLYEKPLQNDFGDTDILVSSTVINQNIAFEDPAEAVLFELRWS